MKESIGDSFSDIQDPRETKEEVLRQILGTEDLDVQDLDEEALDLIMQRLTGIGTIEESTKTIISVMKDLKADENNIVEALVVNLGVHLSEAKEMYEDHKLYG
jgi:predicted HAD superfamily phosphohydrolase